MNTNIRGDFYCKYCGKHSPTKQGCSIHERQCKFNPYRKILIENNNGLSKSILHTELENYKNEGWKIKSNLRHRKQSTTKGKICITNGKQNKYIYKENINKFLANGWRRGSTINFKTKPLGKCKNYDDEIDRRRRISESMKKNPLAGGLREGSGRGKKGKYKGIYCDSIWELAFLVYHLDNNLFIERCKEKRKYIFNNKERIYYPDFITDKGVIEIKGYITDQWKAKLQYNPDINVLYEDDIKFYLDYCINKYGNNFYEILYDKK